MQAACNPYPDPQYNLDPNLNGNRHSPHNCCLVLASGLLGYYGAGIRGGQSKGGVKRRIGLGCGGFRSEHMARDTPPPVYSNRFAAHNPVRIHWGMNDMRQ